MPTRATKRGAARTPLERDADVLVCGASFAGLTVARELARSAPSETRVLILDRYEIGERQTSACAAPTEWLRNLGLSSSIRQTFGELVIHTPRASARYRLPWTFSTFDYRELCALLREQAGAAEFETAKVEGRTGEVVHTDRGDLRAPLIVDALGWRRVLSPTANIQPPDARLSRGLEVHPRRGGEQMEIWIDPSYVPAGYGWSFPAREEVRIGIGSFDPRFHVRKPTERLAADLRAPADRWQGNWIPHKLRRAAEDDVFFVGDSAGHCLPLTAEGIRTAFYFAIACGRELASTLAGRSTRAQALGRYGAFSDAHEWKYRWMLRAQDAIPHLAGKPGFGAAIRAMSSRRFVDWSFGHYLRIAPPEFASAPAAPAAPPRGAGLEVAAT